jgi:hypothetical protein
MRWNTSANCDSARHLRSEGAGLRPAKIGRVVLRLGEQCNGG